MWEEERHTPVRVRGIKDGGGAPGPSTLKGEMESVHQITTNIVIFFAAGRWAGQRAKRRVAWPWQRPQCIFLHRITLAKCENP